MHSAARVMRANKCGINNIENVVDTGTRTVPGIRRRNVIIERAAICRPRGLLASPTAPLKGVHERGNEKTAGSAFKLDNLRN